MKKYVNFEGIGKKITGITAAAALLAGVYGCSSLPAEKDYVGRLKAERAKLEDVAKGKIILRNQIETLYTDIAKAKEGKLTDKDSDAAGDATEDLKLLDDTFSEFEAKVNSETDEKKKQEYQSNLVSLKTRYTELLSKSYLLDETKTAVLKAILELEEQKKADEDGELYTGLRAAKRKAARKAEIEDADKHLRSVEEDLGIKKQKKKEEPKQETAAPKAPDPVKSEEQEKAEKDQKAGSN